jgi:hypothetical protein
MRSTHRLVRSIAQVSALATILLMPGRLLAQGVPNHLYDKFEASANAAVVILGSDIQINGSGGESGTEIDLNDLGISQSAFAPALGVTWRPGKRHQLGLGYLYISRSGNKVLTKDIAFGDSTFTAGAQVNTKFSAPEVLLTYRFAFMAKEKTQLGIQVGLGALFFNVGIDALAGITGGGADTAEVAYSASKSLVGPTATLGLYGMFRAGDHWYFTVNAGVLGASVSNISATNWVAGGEARYYFSKHWAANVGWAINSIKISSEGDGEGWVDLSGSIKYNFQVIRGGLIFALP